MKKLSLFCLMMLIMIIAGCSNEEAASDRFEQYVKLWNDQKFEDMYSYLSQEAKKDVTKDEFVARYQNIYGGAEVKKLKVKAIKSEGKPENNEISLPFEVSMDTAAGKVSFKENALWVEEKVDDKNKWSVSWKPSMIFEGMTDGDEVSVKTLRAERGEITDRSGSYLAQNGNASQVGIVPVKFKAKMDENKESLSKLLNISTEEIDKAPNASWVKEDQFVPIKTMTEDEALKGEEQLLGIEGVQINNVPARVYPCAEACAHLVGYVAPVTAEFLKQHKGEGYNSQSSAGLIGIEAQYEETLRAKDGAVISIVGSDGNVKKEIASKEAENGKNVQLTVDVAMQKKLYEQVKDEKGLGVAIHPTTGDVLGMVSAPSFNPNHFSLGITSTEYSKLSNDGAKPLLNRFNKTYSPGSTFKLLSAALIADSEKFDLNEKRTIGDKWQKDSSWGDFYVTRVGNQPNVNFRDALVTSDNIYFAQAITELGVKAFEQGSKKFGFNEKLPIEFPFQTSKISQSNSIDSELLLANSAYGQGEVQVSPLHLASVYSSIVNDGNMIKPKLVMNEETEPEFWKEEVMSSEAALKIKESLIGVIEDPNGTAKEAKLSNLTLAGKTGTAELKLSQGEKGKENGWFVAVDTESPHLLVAMMVEDVKKGSHDVTPKVKNIFSQK
ncbi:penicillin-binding transpeptidase domain-containing protein [Priestia flexa]|uniref:penicillin-binding transpeptidase domain-containing protein n=1 Tax=Priestia flexa TaxID=86664 RepID=UPI0020A21A81|nr:penicillin-binding transpeptidase domain-containing protein [Priestia flexa]MCP1190812.1 penicillin-binding transpeptidase domain-containing protein [Priestia flexa]